jgi:hypothetical protein
MPISVQMKDRFWHKVLKTETCWLWTNKWRDKDGYAHCYYWGTNHLAHRIAYTLTKGPIPKGLQIDHLCRVRDCVNPDHLEVVTNRENSLRGIGPTSQNAKKTHCIRGHEFKSGTYRIYKGSRICRECKRLAAKDSRACYS